MTLPLDTKLLSLSFEAVEIDAESKIERRVIQEVLMIRNDFVVSEERREIPSHSFAETEFYSNPMDERVLMVRAVRFLIEQHPQRLSRVRRSEM